MSEYGDIVYIPKDDLESIFSGETEWYNRLMDYLVLETEFEPLTDREIEEAGLEIPDGAYGDGYFRGPQPGVLYEGELNGPKNPDGSQSYHFSPITAKDPKHSNDY